MATGHRKANAAKTIVLASALSMVLSACGGGAGKPAPGTTPEKGSTAENQLKPYELVLYFAGDPQKDTPLVEEKINEYLKPKMNAKVKINFIPWSDYGSKMPVMLASGQKIDVMFVNSGNLNYASLASKGALEPVNELLDKHGPDIKKSIYSKFLDITKVNGKNYAIQNPKEIASQWVLRFNQPLASKLGIDVSSVTSVEAAAAILKQAKEKDPSLYPMEATQEGLFYVPFDYVMGKDIPFGVTYDTAASTAKIENMWETPQARKALDLSRQYYKAGYIRPDVATYKMPTNEEQAGKWLTGLAGGIPTADNIWTKRAGFDVKYAPIEKPIVTTDSVAGSMLAIPTTSQDKERAMMLINLLHGDAHLHNLFVYGIEGVHYKKISENKIEDLPARKERYNTAWFEFGNGFLTYLFQEDPDNKWEQFKKFNDSAQTSPLVGFNFDPTPVQTEIAAIKNVSAAVAIPLKSGSVEVDDLLPKAITKFKEAGADKVITEMQKQYDAWKATQK